jgi:histidine triad (HIT) family protein
MNCIFCNIAEGKFQADIVYQDEDVVAFHDINPQAPVHILIIPRKHISTINDVEDSDAGLIGKIILTAKKIAKEKGIAEDGYRILFNCNKMGGQHVYHIHLHLLGGRQLLWPPG